jgi:hypothetical protein
MTADQNSPDGGMEHALRVASWLSADGEDASGRKSTLLTLAAIVALVVSLVGGLTFLENWIAHWDNR